MLWWTLGAYNLVVMAAYGWDKLRARQGRRRTPERTLLWLAACLGGPGALAGMYLFRHKTQKPRFVWGVPLMALVQAAVMWWVLRTI
ncbi:MAG TPA: DUF1294 domain-containing protein [Symbiobacteriaceae bacterium]|nr:DUF1294 domain-containing protein [Symbiobacteriaceae bacterium]